MNLQIRKRGHENWEVFNGDTQRVQAGGFATKELADAYLAQLNSRTTVANTTETMKSNRSKR